MTDKPIKSYCGVVVARHDNLLIGGVKRHVSSRFQTYEQAQSWTETIMASNRVAVRGCDGTIEPSTHTHEIDAD